MKNHVVCDTNIISRYLQGNEKIVHTIDNVIDRKNVYITPVIRMELFNYWLSDYQNLDKTKRIKYKRFILNIPLVHLNEPISKLAVEISNRNINSKPGDILICATAIYHKLKIYTLDGDFKQMKAPLFQ